MIVKPILLPSQEYLAECLRYDPSSGKLFWKERPLSHFKHPGTGRYWNRRHAGTEAFATPAEWGYLRGNLNKRAYLAHRIVWKLVRGTEPPDIVDHRDGIPTNNRDENLREATNAQNCSNGKRKGYYFDAGKGYWVAHVSIGGKKTAVAYCKTEQDAAAARKEAAEKHYGEFARA